MAVRMAYIVGMAIRTMAYIRMVFHTYIRTPYAYFAPEYTGTVCIPVRMDDMCEQERQVELHQPADSLPRGSQSARLGRWGAGGEAGGGRSRRWRWRWSRSKRRSRVRRWSRRREGGRAIGREAEAEAEAEVEQTVTVVARFAAAAGTIVYCITLQYVAVAACKWRWQEGNKERMQFSVCKGRKE